MCGFVRSTVCRSWLLLTGPATSLQSTVDRFAQSLRVAASLHSLHPRTADVPSRALRPAMVLCTIAAFEGFAEEILAAALHQRGDTLYQISEQVNFTNPDLFDLEDKINGLFNNKLGEADPTFSLEVWRLPVGDSGWWSTDVLSWGGTKYQALAWMQVRHALTHGAASGWGGAVTWYISSEEARPDRPTCFHCAARNRERPVFPCETLCRQLLSGLSIWSAGFGQPAGQALQRRARLDKVPDFGTRSSYSLMRMCVHPRSVSLGQAVWVRSSPLPLAATALSRSCGRRPAPRCQRTLPADLGRTCTH